MTDGYDIIGDVHGCAGKLEQLLHTMGYAEVDGAWKHPTRQAVFVGDFIDRGPEQLRSVAIPQAMVAAGNAFVVPEADQLAAHDFTRNADGVEWLLTSHLLSTTR